MIADTDLETHMRAPSWPAVGASSAEMAELGLVSAKLHAARPHRLLVPRPRLLDLTRDRAIVLVVADAGFGKSSFLWEWSRPIPRVVWYTLDDRDRDPTTFGQHLLAAAGADARDVRAFRTRAGRAFAEALAERALAHIEGVGPVGLVLDDVHAVVDSPEVLQSIAQLLTDRPMHVRIALASRTRPPLPLGRLRAHGLVAELGAAELAFSRAETAAALADSDLDPAAIDALFEMSGGWAAAVQLIGDALAGPSSPLPALHSYGIGRRAGFDAFVEEEVLSQLEPSELAALRRLSVVEEIDAPICAALVDDPAAFDSLSRLAERFAFIAEVPDEAGPTYRIHQLVRQPLSRQLSAAERRAALERAADAYEQRARPIDSARAAIALGDVDRLARLALRETARLIAEGHARTVADWFAHLPEEAIEAEPRLLSRRAQLEGELGNLQLSQALFERAAERLEADGQPVAAADALRVMAGQLDQWGNFGGARQALTRSLELIETADEAHAGLALQVRNQLSSIRLRDGDPDGALAMARDVVDRSAAQDNPLVLAIAYHNLAQILNGLGRLNECEQTLQRAIDIKRRHGLDASLAMSLNSLGLLYHTLARMDEAEAALLEAERLADSVGATVVEAYVRSNLGDVYRDRGQLDRARAYYARSLEQKQMVGSQFGLAHTWNSLASLWRRAGDLAQARDYNQRALSSRASDAGPLEGLRYRLESGQIALAAGDAAGAWRELARVAAELGRFGSAHHALEAAWWAAAARLRLEGRLDDSLRAALDAAPERPRLGPLVAEAPSVGLALWRDGYRDAALADALAEHHAAALAGVSEAVGRGETELLDLLPHLAGNAPVQLLSDAERSRAPNVRTAAAPVLEALRRSPPPALEVAGLGGLRVVRRGLPIGERAWRRQRAQELLGLLLLAGPGGRRRDELIVELWPDATQTAGIEQFHTHLHALRAALEPEAARGASSYVIGEGRGYRLEWSLVSSWDVGAFEAALAAGAAADASGDVAAAERSFGVASSLYRGSLFEGLAPEGEWLDLAREKLHQRGVDARVRLARLRETAGDPLGAQTAWQAVLALDPLREDAHRTLMALLRGLGQRDAALAQFRTLTELLDRELGVEPSPETLALYRELLAS